MDLVPVSTPHPSSCRPHGPVCFSECALMAYNLGLRLGTEAPIHNASQHKVFFSFSSSSLPDLLLGVLWQPAHAHPGFNILKLAAKHLGLPGSGAGMLHNLPQGPNQDTKEHHACQHHDCGYALHRGVHQICQWRSIPCASCCAIWAICVQFASADYLCMPAWCSLSWACASF